MQRLADRLRDVDADEVQQLERPHRVRCAELHAGVDLLGLHAGPLQQSHGVEQVGEQQAVDHEAGLVGHLHGVLPIASQKAFARARTPSPASSGKHSSTRLMRRTGLNTCSPKKCAGSPLAVASSETLSEEVVVERTASGDSTRRSEPSRSRFRSGSSATASTASVAARQGLEVRGDGQAPLLGDLVSCPLRGARCCAPRARPRRPTRSHSRPGRRRSCPILRCRPAPESRSPCPLDAQLGPVDSSVNRVT